MKIEEPIYYLFRAPVGSVLFLVVEGNSIVSVFEKNKILATKGTREHCMDYAANVYPNSKVNTLNA
jgi:hypothetical protein